MIAMIFAAWLFGCALVFLGFCLQFLLLEHREEREADVAGLQSLVDDLDAENTQLAKLVFQKTTLAEALDKQLRATRRRP